MEHLLESYILEPSHYLPIHRLLLLLLHPLRRMVPCRLHLAQKNKKPKTGARNSLKHKHKQNPKVKSTTATTTTTTIDCSVDCAFDKTGRMGTKYLSLRICQFSYGAVRAGLTLLQDKKLRAAALKKMYLRKKMC